MTESNYTVEKTSVPLVDQKGRSIGKIILVSRGKGKIIELTQKRARELGEQEVQLFEGCSYEYQLELKSSTLQLREGGGVSKSNLSHLTGRINTGIHTGLFPLILEDPDKKIVATAIVEVLSPKLSRAEYQQMLGDIGEKCADLLLDMRTPMQTRMRPTTGDDPETIQQRFAFLRSILDSRDFQEALQRLIAMPHRRLEAEETERDMRRGIRPSNQTLRQIASRNPRLALPSAHPLAGRMSGLGVTNPSLPAMVTVTQQRDTVDTPENRFVKHALTTYVDFFVKMEQALRDSGRETYKRLTTEVIRLREGLTEVLSRDLFREVSEPTVLPLGSPVLQRKAGYREMLQAWLKFNLAASLEWNGGEDVFGAGKRDVALLYEYWLFFQLLGIVEKKCGLLTPPSDELFKVTEGGISLLLKSGNQLAIAGEYAQGEQRLTVRFSYNRMFRFSGNRELGGTWTRQMRPDFTLSIWPAGFTEEEAEAKGQIAHLHFDAKYRADNVTQLVGRQEEEDDDLQAERAEQRTGIYKRADLLKMHAYKDAIRRTEGAYVLYPGAERGDWRQSDAILPGIGAFAIRPGRDGEATGVQEVAEFLDGVFDHLCTRWQPREEPTS